MMKNLLLCGAIAVGLAACGNNETASTDVASSETAQGASERDQIKIVGSSTVYPFSTTVAENFGRSTSFKTPIVEATGSGGGLKLFCSGVGANHPDMTNASRRIKPSEIERCASNNITDIIEVKVGYDGIVLANSRKSDRFEITLRELYLALAKDIPNGNGGLKLNDHDRWSDINPDLPDTKIEILGPPPTSGTRDAFVELAMEGGCKSFDWIAAMKNTDKDRYKAICHSFREDDNFIEAGENDNLIVQKLNANPNALGIFGYGFLDQNADSVQGTLIDGVMPTFENISEGSYPVSRSLYFYAKKANIGIVPGIEEFLAEFTSERASGQDGYLSEKGLIPMKPEEHAARKASVLALETVSLD